MPPHPGEGEKASERSRRGDGGDHAGPAELELARQLGVSRLLRAAVEGAARLVGAGDLVSVARVATAVMVDDLGATRAELWLAAGPGRLVLAAEAGSRPAPGSRPGTIDIGSEGPSLVGDVARTGLPVVANEVVRPFAPVLDTGPAVTAASVLPIMGGEAGGAVGDRLRGVMAAWFAEPVTVEVADVIAAFAAVVTAAVDAAAEPAPPTPGASGVPPQPAAAQRHDAAVAEAARLRSFVDSLGAILWEGDAATFQLSFVSRRAEELLGYPVERWLEPGFRAEHIHPDDRDYALAYSKVATEGGADHDVAYRMVAADGRDVWLRDIVSVQRDREGVPERLRGVMVDVTDTQRDAQALSESRERFASLARTLQASLLPPHLPEIFGLEVATAFRPAKEGEQVVGDFYDLFDVGGEDWGVVIGDVCGKGADAAALTALARYTVRAAAMRERKPCRVLRLLNEAVLRDVGSERFCTAVFARFGLQGDGATVQLCSGGHPLPLVLRATGEVQRVGHVGTLLGVFEDADLMDDAVVLGPGDSLVLFTDGATEARRGNEQLGEERLAALVGTCARLRAAEVARRLEDGVVTFAGGVVGDDLAIVVLRVPG